MSARLINLNAKQMRCVFAKRKHIYAIEQRDMKIECLKLFYPNHKHIITILECYDDNIIDDLHRISLYKPNYHHPASMVYIGEVLDKYLIEFQRDNDILEFLLHIANQYKCV